MLRLLKLTFLSFLIISCSNTEVKEFYDDDGNLIGKAEFHSADHRNFTYFTYDGLGHQIAVTPYVDSVIHGSREVFDTSGNLLQTGNLKKGKYQGKFKRYYPDGKVKQQGQYEDNKMVGKWTYYYESGSIKEEVNFRDNLENGPFIEYYENGNVKAKGQYKDGDNEDGELHLYAEDGSLERVMECTMGMCITVEDYRKEKEQGSEENME